MRGMDLVCRARQFALEAHGGQKYGEHPYVFHLDQVESVLREFGHESEILRAAAQLHDVLEDTSVSHEELGREFPAEVFDIVVAVTKPPDWMIRSKALRSAGGRLLKLSISARAVANAAMIESQEEY